MNKDTLSAATPPGTMKALTNSALTSRWFIPAVFLVVILAFGLYNINRAANAQSAPQDVTVPVSPLIEERLGIRVTQVAMSADNGLIDFRYQVLDPDKAGQIMEIPEKHPVLIPEGSQVPIKYSLYMPHHEKIVAGHTYYLLYYNTGGVMKEGGYVTIVFGDLKLEHVPVR